MTRPTVFFAFLLALALFDRTSVAAAQDACFTLPGAAGEAGRTQHVVGLSTTVRLSAGCQYAVSADGPWAAPGALAGRDTDFLEIFQHAASQPSARVEGDPRLVVARRTGARQESSHSLMLRYCAHFLLEEQLGFRVVPSGGSFRIERAGGPACDAGSVELRAVEGAQTERLFAGAAAQTLGTSQSRLELPSGDWSIYAARPGGAVGLRVGVFRSQRVVTPLANHIRSVGLEPPAEAAAPPLFAARWDPSSPGLLLHPTGHALAQGLLWPELRTASDAGLLWIAYRELPGNDRPQVITAAQLEAGEQGAVRLPDAPIREHMQRVYGAAGASLAPSPADWRAIFADLALCMAPSYQGARPLSVGSLVPDPGACAALSGLSILAQAEAAVPARMCIRRGVQIMSAAGARHVPGEAPECFALPELGSGDAPPRRVAVAGDRVTVEGQGLCVLLDNEPLAEEGGEYVLSRSGLLEIRQAGGEGCASRQAVARARVPVIDPGREWHPVGLYAGASEEQLRCPGEEGAGVCPWRVLAHDESEVFAFVEARNELSFRLSTSPTVAAALGASPDATVQLTQDVPMLAGVSGSFEGARESAIVAFASRDAACPDAEGVTYADVRARRPLDPDELGPDAEFTVHLLAVEGDDRPVSCLASARFRARPSRALGAFTVSDFLGLELGLLGDTQLAVFISDPVAIGLVLPIAWFRLTPGQRWISFDVAANLVGAVAFPGTGVNADGEEYPFPASVSRLGVSLSWAVTLGWPDYLPRLLSIGGMLHGAAETHAGLDNPIVSFYVSLNLATLIDLAGGR